MLLNLFLTFLKIGLFAFGGGYAMIPLIQHDVVTSNNWLAMSEFLQIITVAEMTPGPIAINLATFTGYKLAGFLGSLVSTIGVTLPSFCIVLILTKTFLWVKENPKIKGLLVGLRSAVLALIISAAVSIGKTAFIDFRVIGIALACFVTLLWLNPHPAIVIAIGGGAGILLLLG
ncbi:chromate transporter [Candidatus Aerophobetes bacterium]|nr:chromate transporter [Candidatus Aerophobetes bacterium]